MARTKEAMAEDIEKSLHNLRTDHIELYQVHNPSMEQLDQVQAAGGALEALQEARAAGKIRTYWSDRSFCGGFCPGSGA